VTASPRDAAAANHAATEIFAALDVRTIALLLDVDGTLVDIAPRPDEVHVPDDLCQALERLLARTGGALALVSGRPIRDLDGLFLPLKLPIVGGHGAEIRVRAAVISPVEPLPEDLRAALAAAQRFDPGILIEDKGYSVALHFRNAPQAEARLRDHVVAVRAEYAGEATEVLPGKALFEVKRPGVNKGNGVRELMRHAPFAGRRPVFIGDDVTDEAVFAVLPGLGGIGFSVSRHFEGVAGIFESPQAVRRALQRLADIA
jgi:trehalose 6-phosphate phosphatase